MWDRAMWDRTYKKVHKNVNRTVKQTIVTIRVLMAKGKSGAEIYNKIMRLYGGVCLTVKQV